MNVTKTTIIAILAVLMATLISAEGGVVEGGEAAVGGGAAVEGGGLRKTRTLYTWEGTVKKWNDFWDDVADSIINACHYC